MKTIELDDYIELRLIDGKIGVVSRCGELVRFGEYQINVSKDNRTSKVNGEVLEESKAIETLKPSNKVYAQLITKDDIWMLALREVRNIEKSGRVNFGDNVVMMSVGLLSEV